MDKIAVILYGNIRYDGRVQKEIASLKKNRKEVILFCSDFDEDDFKENYNFEIKVIKNKVEKRGVLYTFLNLRKFQKEVLKELKNIKVQYIHCNDLNTLIMAKKLSKFGKIIYDAHELFPESQESKIKRAIWNFIEKINIKYAYKIIQPEHNRKKYFSKKHNISIKKIALIENFPLNIKNTFKSEENYFQKKFDYQNKNKKIALYIGIIMPKRNILEMIEGIKEFENLTFFCIGKSSDRAYLEKLREYIKENKLDNRVFIKEAIPQKEVMLATISADISFIFYQNTNLNNYYCASNKLYECLNSGLKIITNDYPGILDVTKGIPNVYNVKEINTDEIKRGIEILLKEEKVIKTDYYWENQEEKFIKIYSEN